MCQFCCIYLYWVSALLYVSLLVLVSLYLSLFGVSFTLSHSLESSFYCCLSSESQFYGKSLWWVSVLLYFSALDLSFTISDSTEFHFHCICLIWVLVPLDLFPLGLSFTVFVSIHLSFPVSVFVESTFTSSVSIGSKLQWISLHWVSVLLCLFQMSLSFTAPISTLSVLMFVLSGS